MCIILIFKNSSKYLSILKKVRKVVLAFSGQKHNRSNFKMENKNGALSTETLKKFRKNLESDPKNLLALNACSKTDPMELCLQRSIVESTNHVFTHKVDSEVKPISNQKNSGRCWTFAALNVMRIPFVKHHQLDEFEFSHSYIFFWDKIERCNYFLHTVVDVLKRGETIDGRLMTYLMHEPAPDGGQWDFVVNVIKRYGVMPKKCFPESFCCETSLRLNAIIKSKLREYTKELDDMVKKKSSQQKLDDKIGLCMEEIYRIVAICLGIPPETFTWEYYNKSKAYCVVRPITPLKFYEEYVKPYCCVESKVCLVNDPRPQNPYNQMFTVDCLGNMVGGQKVLYLNQSSKDLLKYAAESIKSNEAVWFGCEMGKKYSLKLGIQDLRIHDYKLLFGVDVHQMMSKSDKLIYGDSCMNHAMCFTAVSVDAEGDPTKWRVENSWGDDRGEKGFMVMTSEWFKEYVFEIVVDKKFLPKEVLDLLNTEPKVLPAWDPMGTLA